MAARGTPLNIKDPDVYRMVRENLSDEKGATRTV